MIWKYYDEQWGSKGSYDAPQIFDVTNPDEPKIVATVAVRAEMEEHGLLLAAAPEMGAMLLSMFSHVSHGGPTRAEAEVLLKKAGLLP